MPPSPLLAFRGQDLSILGETLGAEGLSGGSVTASLLAALAAGGWVFIGFDACVGMAEETRESGARRAARDLVALLSVGVLVIPDAVATTLAHPDLGAVVAGHDVDPVQTAVVLAAFLACGIAAQSVSARAMYSIDVRVTNNGDGTFTALYQIPGPERIYGPDGQLLNTSGGTIRFAAIIDYGGTPSDPSDDVFISEEFVSDHGGQPQAPFDFCDSFRDLTG